MLRFGNLYCTYEHVIVRGMSILKSSAFFFSVLILGLMLVLMPSFCKLSLGTLVAFVLATLLMISELRSLVVGSAKVDNGKLDVPNEGPGGQKGLNPLL